MWSRAWVLLALVGLGVPVQAGPLVVIAPEVLRGDVLERTRPDGSPVAPRLVAWAADAFVATDVETPAVGSRDGLRALGAPLDAADLLIPSAPWPEWGPVRVVASPRRREAVEALIHEGWSAQALVRPETGFAAVVDSLLRAGDAPILVLGAGLATPWAVEDPGLLRELDPTPWRGGDRNRTMEGQLLARDAAASRYLGRWTLDRVEDPAELNRAHDAALAEWDARWGGLLDAIETARPEAWIVVTASGGIGLGGPEAIGTDDVRREQVHVPFLVQGPEAGTSSAVAPVGAWLAAVREATAGGSWSPPGSRVTTSVAWPVSLPPRVRVRDGVASLVTSPTGDGRVFDRAVDPRELRDVASLEPEAHARLQASARERFGIGDATLVVRVEAGEAPELVEITITGVDGSTPPTLEGLDPIDSANVVEGVLHLSLVTDPEGDGVAVRWDPTAARIRIEVDRDPLGDDAGPLPLHFGSRSATTGRLESWTFSREWAAASSDAAVAELLGEPAGRGVHVWIRREP